MRCPALDGAQGQAARHPLLFRILYGCIDLSGHMVVRSELLGLFFGHLRRVKNQITQLLAYRGEPFQVGGRGGGFHILIYKHDEDKYVASI